MRPILLVIFALIVVGCAGPMPAPGRLVDVGGQMMHIHCVGQPRGWPTVVIDGGHLAFSPMYMRLQNALSKKLRVCSYDRMGLGWSEGVTTPRQARQMARELHGLLRGADIEPPYVLAGHSLGGLTAIRYAHDYPDEVAALVLLDPTHPQQDFGEADLAASIKNYKTLRLFTRLGLTYFYVPGYIKSRIDPLPQNARDQLRYFVRNPAQATKMVSTAIAEMEGLPTSLAQVEEVTALGDIPLLVITAKPWLGGVDASEEYVTEQKSRAQAWFELHENYAALSAVSRHTQLKEG